MQALPPFAAIRAFEAAARHLSFKEAAQELGLTPTAISHQIRQLERLTGRALFIRHTRRVELTVDGRRFADDVAPALDALATAFARLRDSSGRDSVTLGAGPIFASRWLVPRLARFWDHHPGIDLRLHHSPLPVWQQIAQFDLAIAWGAGGWPGVVSEPLLRIEVSPVVSPELAGHLSDPPSPEQLLSLPLLHHRNQTGWREWLRAVGVTMPVDLPGIVFEDANVMTQAALSGRGAALGILPFVADELSSGRLVQPFPLSVDPGDAYFLIYRQRALANDAVASVRQWLLESR